MGLRERLANVERRVAPWQAGAIVFALLLGAVIALVSVASATAATSARQVPAGAGKGEIPPDPNDSLVWKMYAQGQMQKSGEMLSTVQRITDPPDDTKAGSLTSVRGNLRRSSIPIDPLLARSARR